MVLAHHEYQAIPFHRAVANHRRRASITVAESLGSGRDAAAERLFRDIARVLEHFLRNH